MQCFTCPTNANAVPIYSFDFALTLFGYTLHNIQAITSKLIANSTIGLWCSQAELFNCYATLYNSPACFALLFLPLFALSSRSCSVSSALTFTGPRSAIDVAFHLLAI